MLLSLNTLVELLQTPNSTTTKCVTNVKHKDIFPEMRKGFIELYTSIALLN